MFGPPLYFNFFVKKTDFHLLLVMKQGLRCANTIGAGWIGAPIYWRTDVPPPPIGNPDQAWCANNISRIFFCVRSAITVGAGGFGAPIVLADYKEDDWVRCALPIFIPIAY
jgi:hypothetical protein